MAVPHPAPEEARCLHRVCGRAAPLAFNLKRAIVDRLADRYDMEKIKAIGDAYMVAGGITPEGGGVEQVAEMALDMSDAMRDYASCHSAQERRLTG